jgi:pyruvate/2-oxoacid:ferredoxin oxidoreductase beta subunit
MKKIESLTPCVLGFDQESIKKFFEKKYNMEFSYDKYFEYLENTSIVSLEQDQIDHIF